MTFDLPQIPMQETGIVILAQALTAEKRLENEPGPFNSKYDAVLGECVFAEYKSLDVPVNFRSAINDLAVLSPVAQYLKLGPDEPLSNARITLLSSPKYGSIQPDPDAPTLYKYLPVNDPDDFGKDRVVFEVEANGKRFKVIFTVYIVGSVDQVPPKLRKLCPNPGIGYRIVDYRRRKSERATNRRAVVLRFAPTFV